MEFRVLGPVGIWRDSRLLSVVGQKQRTLLAALVLNANRVVSQDRLLVALWGNAAPASGRRLLHNHLWSLRRLLADASVLVSTPMGYSLKIPADASDLSVFLAESDAARAALTVGDPVQAAERFRRALALWRGPALAGTSPGFQSTEGAALEERRIVVLAERIEADLALGRDSELIGELRQLVTENPLHERLRSQLMLALHRAGRTAEALEEYRNAHQHFRGELGLEPGENLARLHQEILSADPRLNLGSELQRAETPASSSPSLSVPRQLPSDVVRFTGREESLKQLDLLLSAGQDGASAVVITAIAGTAGVGKTALATRWGHRVADRFPDGQLYVNLHGYSQEEPVTGAQALRQLLGGLGVAADAIPHEVGEREALYRSLIAGKQILVMLDNAARADQIRPLLPGSSSCKVVITSRDSLRGLSVTHDVRTIALEVLSAEEAQALFVTVLGPDRVCDDMDAVIQLARLCGYLPLALRLAAAHLASEPTLTIGDFAARLHRENPLTVLEIEEDPSIGVRTAFELSYRALPESARLTFRMIGLAPGSDIGFEGVAVLTGLPVRECRAAIDTLINAHLVSRCDDRLTMHDLMRVYARDRSETDDLEADSHAALSRLFDWYLRTAVAAVDRISPGYLTEVLDISLKDDDRRKFKYPDDSWGWIKTEHRSLMAVIAYGASHGWFSHSWRTARTLSMFFNVNDRIDDWIITHQIGLSAARAIGDKHGKAEMLCSLGYAYMMTGNYQKYLYLQWQALSVRQEMGDKKGQAEALSDIGHGLTRVGELAKAIEVCEKSIELERLLSGQSSPTGASYRLAIAYLQIGRPGDSLSGLNAYREYERERGNRQNEAYALLYLGVANIKLDRLTLALECVQEALEIGKEIGAIRLEADALNGLGNVYRRQKQYAKALNHQNRALSYMRESRTRELECEIHVDLGNTYLEAGDKSSALKHYQAALDLSLSLGLAYFQGYAHKGLAEALEGPGREESKIHLKEALAIFAPMGVPEAGVVAERLAAL